MAYTIGIKRRWLPGYRRLLVTGHAWQHGRFILDLNDGSQEHIVGAGIRVYTDFWAHLAHVKKSQPIVQPEPQPVAAPTPAPVEPTDDYTEPPPLPVPETPMMQLARQRAMERIKELHAN